MPKKAIMLINIGTPENTSTGKVRKYLREFLGDRRVMDLPWLARKILVNLIITPFRAPKSAKLYKKLWTDKGSPLLVYGYSLQQKLQAEIGNDYIVELAMRYEKPSIEEVLAKIHTYNVSEIIIVPLFPQYASSTSGSIIEKTLSIISKWNDIPTLKVISNFYQNSGFIKPFANRAKQLLTEKKDHILFSYHGLPLPYVYKSHNNESCDKHNCTHKITKSNLFCYQAQCFDTSRLIAKELNLSDKDYTVCFQSRFAKNWLSPFTDDEIKKQAQKGAKNLLVISPSFVADCLETIIEIGKEYSELFRTQGGEELHLVPSLNDGDDWVDGLMNIILE